MTTNKSQTFMVLAVLLGVAAAVAGYFGLTSLAGQASARSTANFRDVVVASRDLDFGVKLDKDMLRVVRYPKDAIPAGAYSTVDSVAGQTLKVAIGAREPVTDLKLSSKGGGLSLVVPPNFRAASIEVNNVSGVSGFVYPGDFVDVLCTIGGPGGVFNDAETHTVLQRIKVLAAGAKTQQQDNKPINVQAITLLVDPPGAEALTHSMHQGVIHLVLRNPLDTTTVKVAAFTTREMERGKTGPEKPAPARRARVVERPAPQPMPVAQIPARQADPRKIRIIRSADVSETPAVSDTTAK